MKENKYISTLLLVTLVFLVNILSSFINWNIDLTADKKHSLSQETHTIINTLDDRLLIKVYLEGDFPAGFKKLQKATENLLRKLKSITDDNIDFQFINPNESDNNEENNALSLQLEKLGLVNTILKNGDKIYPGALIYYKDKPAVAVNFYKQVIISDVNTIDAERKDANEKNIKTSIENLEFEFISAIHYLSKEKLDKIAFLDGNGELNERQVFDISGFLSFSKGSSLNNFNLSCYYNVDRFDIKVFALDSTETQPNLSRQLAMMNAYKVIIIAKPTIPFNNLDKLLIDQYVMSGGKILWLVDGVYARMDSLQNKSGDFVAVKNDLNIDDQLKKYGVKINANVIEDLRSTKISIITGYSNNKPQESLFNWPYFPLLKSDNEHVITKGLDGIKCNFVSSIDTVKNNINKTILLHSSKQSRLNPAPTKISLGILEHPPKIESYNKAYEPIAILLEGEFESIFKESLVQKNNDIQLKNKSIPTKMIVVADGDLISNDVSSSGRSFYELGYDINEKKTYHGNKHFLINAIHYLCDDISLSHLKSKELSLRMLDKEKVQKYKFLLQLGNIISPIVLLLIFSLYFFLNKKRKYA